MPWCPKCKTEYVDGTTTCADCGTQLVENEVVFTKDFVEVYSSSNETKANKLLEFLQYSGIQTVEMETKETADEKEFHVNVSADEQEQAEKYKEAFELADDSKSDPEVTGESEESLSDGGEREKEKDETETLDEDDEMNLLRPKASTVYVRKAVKYEDYKFSAISFLIFGVIGLLFVLMNAMGFISLLNEYTTLIMVLLFVIFIVVGILSFIKASKVKLEVGEEESETDCINEWMNETFTKDWFASIKDSDQSEEYNYFGIMNEMKSKLMVQFPTVEEAYLEQLADEFYYKENE